MLKYIYKEKILIFYAMNVNNENPTDLKLTQISMFLGTSRINEF
jgi:hypothetical protein